MDTLNEHEARVFGVLIEKALTTPDQYPLSLNAATAGANQKSNRNPLTDYLHAEVDVALQGLMIKGFAGRVQPAGGRVEKFRHNGHEKLGLGDAELAILAELLMRGPQTPGELRGRANRMSPIPSLGELSAHIEKLIESGHVEALGPAPGSRTGRHAQSLAPGLHPLETAAAPAAAASAPASAPAAPAGPTLATRVETLEAEVAELRRKLEGLCTELGASADRAEP